MHEVDTTLRLLHPNEDTWVRKTELYSEIQNKAIKTFGSMSGQLLLAYLIATSLRNGTSISIKLATFEASVPAAYFLFATSFLFIISATFFNHLSTAMSLKIRLGSRMIHSGFSMEALDLLKGRSDTSLGIPTIKNYFLRELIPISTTLGSFLLIFLFAGLVPFLALGHFLISEQFELAWSEPISLAEKVSAGAGSALTAISGFIIILFHTPIPFIKNTSFIRWNVLFRLPPHPTNRERIERWLNDE